jgi:hypothetical protein
VRDCLRGSTAVRVSTVWSGGADSEQRLFAEQRTHLKNLALCRRLLILKYCSAQSVLTEQSSRRLSTFRHRNLLVRLHCGRFPVVTTELPLTLHLLGFKWKNEALRQNLLRSASISVSVPPVPASRVVNEFWNCQSQCCQREISLWRAFRFIISEVGILHYKEPGRVRNHIDFGPPFRCRFGAVCLINCISTQSVSSGLIFI